MLISASLDVIRILGEPLRGRIVALLADGPARVDLLLGGTRAKQPTVSHHLRTLRTTAERIRTGTHRDYT